MGTVTEAENTKSKEGVNNERTRPASAEERAIIDAVEFADDLKVQTFGSDEKVSVELPKYIICKHQSHGAEVYTLIDCSRTEPETLMQYFADAVKIRVQMCTRWFAKDGETHFYVDATEDGLTGITQERGNIYSFTKCLNLIGKLRAKTITDAELEYLTKHKDAYKRDKAAADAAGDF